MQIQNLPGDTARPDRENIVLVVRGYEERDGGRVGVRGVNPTTRREETVVLTASGPEAENPRRPALEKLRGGYRAQRRLLRLEEGGVIAFSRAARGADGVYEAPWPEVLAYDRESAKATLSRFEFGLVVMFDDPKPDRSPGDLFAFHPERGFVASTPDEVEAGVAGYLGGEGVRGQTLLVRMHQEGRPPRSGHMPRALVTKEGDRWRPMTAEEAASWARACAVRLAEADGDGHRFSVLPVRTWRLSKMLDREKVQVPALAFYTEGDVGQRAYGARVTYVKFSGGAGDEECVGERFVNAFFVEGPYGQRGGIDPDTLPVPGQ